MVGGRRLVGNRGDTCGVKAVGGGEPPATEREGEGSHLANVKVLRVEGEVASDLGGDRGGRDVEVGVEDL